MQYRCRPPVYIKGNDTKIGMVFVYEKRTNANNMCAMKKLKILIATLILSAGLAGCSSAYYASSGYSNDDLYALHDKTAIARKQQAKAEAEKAAAEARRAQWEARLAEAEAAAAENGYYTYNSNPYEDILADDYESAYARRLRGFESPTYRMPSSYYNFRYGSAFTYATAYDPAFYNIIISGDQVWVEPKYITSMFGTWGGSPYYGGWYFGWNYSPSWWGYPSYAWSGWNWGFGISWYDPWWGWGHPHWGPGWRPGWGPGWGPGWHDHHYTGYRPRSYYGYSGRGNSYSGRGNSYNSGRGTSYNSGRGNSYNSGRGSSYNSGRGNSYNSGRGSSYNSNRGSSYNSGRGSSYNSDRGSSYNNNRGSSYNTDRGSSYNNNRGSSSSYNSGSSSRGSSGGSGSSGRSSGGGGRSYGGR